MGINNKVFSVFDANFLIGDEMTRNDIFLLVKKEYHDLNDSSIGFAINKALIDPGYIKMIGENNGRVRIYKRIQ